MEENHLNNKADINEEVVIVDQMPEYPALDNPELSYKKNLLRLLILSGMGLVTLVLLGISFFFVFIKI